VVVEGLPRPDRAGAVVAAAAHDLNDELTIIFSSLTNSLASLAPGHPAHELLLEARCAAQRCAWKASGLLNYSARRGARPNANSMESVISLEPRPSLEFI